jgi:hypothetical protein
MIQILGVCARISGSVVPVARRPKRPQPLGQRGGYVYGHFPGKKFAGIARVGGPPQGQAG